MLLLHGLWQWCVAYVCGGLNILSATKGYLRVRVACTFLLTLCEKGIVPPPFLSLMSMMYTVRWASLSLSSAAWRHSYHGYIDMSLEWECKEPCIGHWLTGPEEWEREVASVGNHLFEMHLHNINRQICTCITYSLQWLLGYDHWQVCTFVKRRRGVGHQF